VDNPYRFVRNDPKHSPLWICAPDNRVMNERDGARKMITVDRGEYVPNELHLQNFAGGNMSDQQNFMDSASTTVYLRCEAGSRLQSEFIASLAYSVVKIFRRQLMKEFDILNIKLGSISAPQELNDAPGNPWVTIVSLRVELQEYAYMTELANPQNQLNIIGDIRNAYQQNLGSAITDDEFPPVPPLPGFRQ
jgi:hypothetical protein